MGQDKGKKPVSYEDIEALPPGWVGEIVAGELYASPRPAVGHLKVSMWLGALLATQFEMTPTGPGGWWFLTEPELHFEPNIVVPDIAGWRRERVPAPPDPETPWLTIAPDWLCEVLSPSTRTVDRVRKMPLYHREGVQHAWLIDPVRRTLEVYGRGKNGWVRTALYGGNTVIREAPFEDVSLDLGRLWTPGPSGTAHP
ncbi:Uma2 family endonuclease [Pyxidicoccus parkwayensis]|uniref:Uma2 family endonuclease n=1 Tax=Pyxidicoccus parkwayensis TaxID=2813578 RepID=A0ABX7P6Y9_9BACT|nr:Uma2 family endonuclease [Pyxidicoccus parkwaysis]QSQ26259.1 Uma2 family endonuclease [Pyxidicoccus parkwaysis]